MVRVLERHSRRNIDNYLRTPLEFSFNFTIESQPFQIICQTMSNEWNIKLNTAAASMALFVCFKLKHINKCLSASVTLNHVNDKNC